MFDAEGLTSPNKIAINKGKNMIKNLEMIDAIGPREPFAGVATIVYQKAFWNFWEVVGFHHGSFLNASQTVYWLRDVHPFENQFLETYLD